MKVYVVLVREKGEKKWRHSENIEGQLGIYHRKKDADYRAARFRECGVFDSQAVTMTLPEVSEIIEGANK